MGSQVRVVRCVIVAALVATLGSVAGSATDSADASPIITQQDLVGPPGSTFGEQVLVLENGNYVVADSGYDNGANLDVGAVHLYDGFTNTVIDTVTGTTPGDQIGSDGVVEVGTSNYVIMSRFWDHGGVSNVGAVTFGDGTTGVAGTTVSTTNSLHGTTANDYVDDVTTLTNGNYVVESSGWDNGGVVDAGAVTFGDGTTGITGPVTTANSLHGTATYDWVGRGGVTALTNGNYTVASIFWNNGPTDQVGAVTFGDGTTGITGPVTTINSLHGTTRGDWVGNGVTALTNGNYVVASFTWSDGATRNVGAVTFGDGTTGITGPVTTANSLHGTTDFDNVGHLPGAVALSNGNYIVTSPFWSNGATRSGGAVTLGDGTTGTVGPVTTSNSLYGTTDFDHVGFGVTALTNGNYTVGTSLWDHGGAVNSGAVTFGNGDTGIVGPVTTSNSLYGPAAYDLVGNAVTALTNGNYIVASPSWSNGGVFNVGAVTFGDGTTGITGPVTTTNSLHGTTADDEVGRNSGAAALTDGNYVVTSPWWDNGTTANAGAVTFGDGTTGITGPVSTTNSLHGTTAFDAAGSSGVTALTNGNYAVTSPYWDNGATANAGAVTLGEAAEGVTGPISSSNSAIGTPPGVVLRPGGRLTSGDALPIPTTQNRVLMLQLAPPIVVPSAPSGVSGVAGNAQVVVSWTAPSSDGGSPITGYTVTASPGGKTCSTSGATGCTVTGLTNGTAYTFTVTATNAIGTGPASTASAPVTPVEGAIAPPSAPSGVSGVAGDGRVVVSWTAPASDGGSPIIGYTVTASPGGTTCSTAGALSCAVTGLTNGTAYRFTVTATNAIGAGPASTASAPVTPMAGLAAGPDVVTVEPARLLDTRPTGSTVDDRFVGAGKIQGGEFTRVKIAGRGGVAADAVGVELNITAIQNEGRGFATLYPCTATVPTASSLNYTPGVNIANATTVALNSAGEVCVFSNVTAHYALDVLAYVPAGSDVVTVEPARLLDTRSTGSTVDDRFVGAGKVEGGEFTRVQIAGRGGVAADAVGVELNITAIQNEGRGFATLYPCTPTVPTASSLNYTPGVNIANATTVALNAAGEVCVFSNVTAHYALDVLAYVPAGSDVVTVEPARLLDTRPTGSTVDDRFVGAGKVEGGEFTRVQIAGRGGVAADAVGVELNITAIQNEGRGFATLYPCTPTVPTASSLNYTPGVNIANATTVALNAAGEVCVYSNVTAHYALDVLAYVAA